MAPEEPWVLDVFETEAGDKPAWSFIAGLEGRNRVEAVALVKLLEERGNTLRRPHSGALGEGLFELRGKEVRLFYVFRPGRVVVLLEGEIKKRDDIPKRTLARLRAYQREVARRAQAASRRRKGR
jgi:hypothetical protein